MATKLAPKLAPRPAVVQGGRFGSLMARQPIRADPSASMELPFVSQPPAFRQISARAEPNEPRVPKTESATPVQASAQKVVRRSLGSLGGSRFQATGPWIPDTKFSDEQSEAINCPAKTVVVNAFAGTGKTTTAVGYAARRPGSKVLYMPFGKTVQLEAMKRFPPNTVCQTINSAAWEAAGSDLRVKLSNSFTPLVLREELNLRTTREAALTLAILNHFMSSADKEFKPYLIQTLTEGRWRASESEAAQALTAARMAWRRMVDASDKMPIPHDTLLKLWSLKSPKLPYEYIIFDEAQDTNPVTADIINNQTHATRLYIGDRHQAIYGFRGAMNAMEEMSRHTDAMQLALSQTWRFGPKIANVANLILGELKGEKTLIVGMGQDGTWKKGDTYTRLSRTNAQLFRDAAARKGKGIHWAGPNGISGYNINRLSEAYNLFNKDTCKDPVLRKFSSWGELQSYAEDAKDPEIRMLVQVVDEFRHDTPALVKDMIRNEVSSATGADVVFTTAHKAKGLDWGVVEVADDFSILEDAESTLAEDPFGQTGEQEQEINLLYVACTRAKTALLLNGETCTWMENIDKHRIARNLATQKFQRRQEAAKSFLQR